MICLLRQSGEWRTDKTDKFVVEGMLTSRNGLFVAFLIFQLHSSRHSVDGKTLPSYDALKNKYPGYGRYTTQEVKRLIGGRVNAGYIDNTCAIRVSRALNMVGGHDITSAQWDPVGNRYDSVRGGDEKHYIFRVTGLARYLTKTYKSPRYSSCSSASSKFRGKKGIMRLNLSGSSSFTGHFALWGGYSFYQSANYLGRSSCTGVYFWETPGGRGGSGGGGSSSGGGRGGGCFPPLSNVIDSKGTIPIQNVQVGDKILALAENGKLQYSEVVGWMHFEKDMILEYYEIHLANGKMITLSENHLIVKANGAGEQKSYAFASNIKVGDLLLTKDDATPDSVVTPSAVVNITKSWIAGAYAPLTREGTIIVDDVAASCYASVDDHDLIHAALFPVRVVHRIIPGMFQGDSSYLGTYLDFLKYGARLVMDKKQFHPISSINNKVITIF